MRNFPFKFNDKTYWYSRAAVVGMFVFCKDTDNDWCILVNKRGPGCPSNVGKWNVPGGFVDFDETLKEAAIRECKEETGVTIPVNTVKLYSLHDIPTGETQNISFKFYSILTGIIDDYPGCFDYMEKDEVTDIQWVKISNLKNYKWAFNHYNNIMSIYNNVIHPGIKQRILNRIAAICKYTVLFP